MRARFGSWVLCALAAAGCRDATITADGGPDNDGASSQDAGSCRAPADGGFCIPALTDVDFENGGFESGDLRPGWEGPSDPPYYAGVACEAARTGGFGVRFDDVGFGVPRVFQKVPVTPNLWGESVEVSAFMRMISLPAGRLILSAFQSDGGLLITSRQTDTKTRGAWERLSVQLRIPNDTSLITIEITAADQESNGVAFVDDAAFCLSGVCSNACL